MIDEVADDLEGGGAGAHDDARAQLGDGDGSAPQDISRLLTGPEVSRAYQSSYLKRHDHAHCNQSDHAKRHIAKGEELGGRKAHLLHRPVFRYCESGTLSAGCGCRFGTLR